MDTIQVIERIRRIPGVQIDCGLGQGHEAFLAHIHRQYSEVLNVPLMPSDWYISEFERCLEEIQTEVSPNRLPGDYAFFLENYGGLSIVTSDYNLVINGIGPMVEEWYGFLLGDDGIYKNNLLAIAALVLKKEPSDQRIRFFLDLAGVVCQYCVIGINSRHLIEVYPPTLQNPQAYADHWTKLADSFTGWLEKAAETKGTFDYI